MFYPVRYAPPPVRNPRYQGEIVDALARPQCPNTVPWALIWPRLVTVTGETFRASNLRPRPITDFSAVDPGNYLLLRRSAACSFGAYIMLT